MRDEHKFHIVRAAPNGQLQRPMYLSACESVAYERLRSSCRNKLQRNLSVLVWTLRCNKKSRSRPKAFLWLSDHATCALGMAGSALMQCNLIVLDKLQAACHF